MSLSTLEPDNEVTIDFLWNASKLLPSNNTAANLLKSHYINRTRSLVSNSSRYVNIPIKVFGANTLCTKCSLPWGEGKFGMKLSTKKYKTRKNNVSKKSVFTITCNLCKSSSTVHSEVPEISNKVIKPLTETSKKSISQIEKTPNSTALNKKEKKLKKKEKLKQEIKNRQHKLTLNVSDKLKKKDKNKNKKIIQTQPKIIPVKKANNIMELAKLLSNKSKNKNTNDKLNKMLK